MVVPFDDHDKRSLSIFVIFERNMLSPTDSWMLHQHDPDGPALAVSAINAAISINTLLTHILLLDLTGYSYFRKIKNS